jgi:transcriptional regulator with XRE-family HTH domain
MNGNRIRQLRKERNMKIKELGDELGIPVNTLGNYERGDREPNIETYVLLADYFNVSIDYLIGRTEKRTNEEHFLTNDSANFQELLKDAPKKVRKAASLAYEHMYLFVSSAIDQKNIIELEQLNEVLYFLYRMKTGFPNSKFANNGFAPAFPQEAAMVYIEEKVELEKAINHLFKFYVKSHKYQLDTPLLTHINETIQQRIKEDLANLDVSEFIDLSFDDEE